MATSSPWKWEKQDVKEWVDRLFGEQLAIAFEDNDVTGHLLLTEVNEEVLRENIIVESWGLRKRILNAINDLLQRYPADNTSISPPKPLPRSSVAIARNKPLTIDEIWRTLDQHINNVVIPKWENEKKPLLERSAYAFWFKRRSCHGFIQDCEFALDHILNHRIPRICEALAQSGATQIGDLLRVSASLEVACCDARKLMWQIKVLQGPKPPAPADSSLIPLNKKEKLAHKADKSSSDDESLSSDHTWSSMISDDETYLDQSDSDWNDFIVEDDAISDEGVAVEYHSGEDNHFYPSSQGTEEESDGSQSSSSLVRQQKRPRDSSDSDESDSFTKRGISKRISKPSPVSEKHTLYARSNRHRSRKIKRVHDEEVSAVSTQDSETDTAAMSQKRRQLKSAEQSDHGSSGKDQEVVSTEHESDTSLSTLSDSSISVYENEKTGSNGLRKHQKQRAVSDTSEVDDDPSIRYLLSTYISEQNLPHVTNTFSIMSNASILDLFLSFSATNFDDLSNDEQELLEELKPIFSQLSGDKDLTEMVKDDEQRLSLINGLQVVRDMLSEKVKKKKSTRVRKRASRLRKNRRILLSNNESDTSDGEVSSLEVKSSTTDTLLASKKGFRKIRDESTTVSSMRKHHQQMWKEIEARAESELTKKQESDTDITMNVGDVETAKRVTISPHLARHLKKHQIEGIRFLWRQTMMLQTGGVLGHAMGLGKTLQVITYLHTIFREIANGNPDLPEKVKPGRILILAPVTTLKNWENEFKTWIPRSEQSLIRQVINYSSYKATGGYSRETVLRTWFKRGGVLLMGYEVFRQTVKNMDSSPHPIRKWLVDPGPSVVIIDEGHRIKSNKSQLSSVVKMFDTKFRICMTGYPLQNNLEEYYCMIDFVYPGYLGTLSEFRNAYKNPIEYFYEDISPAERFISRRQLYKLQRTLADLIHRRDTAILQSELKPKKEFDVFCKLSTEQYDAYKRCLDDAGVGRSLAPIQALQVLRNICNHPAAFLEQLQNGQSRASDDFSQGRKKLDSNTMAETSNVLSPTPSSPDTPNVSPISSGMNVVPGFDKMIDDEEVTISKEVASAFQTTREYLQNISDLESIELSCKCTVMMKLVKESIKVEDKLIIFSHSIPTLNYISRLMKRENIDNLRIDGSTPVILRQEIIDKFNKGKRWHVILVSSKAASIGINLVSANRVILYDLDWNPCHNEQAVARAYRFGQKKDVFVYRLQTYDTIEQSIFRINEHKTGISSRVVDDKTLKPQKLVVMKAFYKLPAPSPIEPLMASAYTVIEDPVLKVVAEACKHKLADIQLHTSYTTEYAHEELNEKQKEEIEQQLTLENRIRNGEVMEVATATQEIITIADSPPETDATQTPLLPHPQLPTTYRPRASHHPSATPGVPFSAMGSIPQPSTKFSGSAFASPALLFRANLQYQQPILTPSGTASTEWKRPQTVSRSMNSTEQPYRESNHDYSQSTSDLPHNRQHTANLPSNIPNTFRGPNNIAYPNSTAYYREDTLIDTAELFRQQVEKFKLQLKDYGNKFPGGTSSGNLPNNSSLQ
ncbi:hypothetical protein K450DRAFT_249653 [Umbelopsis ramanniana AG]|uniref:Uncharacterized protein n=1 Tax=Umbelopsis ramanniana AG TaxID=1314678 RepID=A0AAD5E6U1_UMBRA|nr:uncharacterized protein K450DRAFT_249653 [Umbelopsis ramanniana AG]KAI8577869.1 hypothetical protein K450DRAFT_249653 [Umbelopsis ramanniana AG]